MARPKKVITLDISAKYYEVLTDGILGSIEHINESTPQQLKVLKGRVTGADLVAAGCDIEWLVSTGQITEFTL